MTHHILAQPKGPHLFAINDLRLRDLDGQVRLDRRRTTGFVTKQTIEDHVGDSAVVAGRRPVRISRTEIRGVDAEPQHMRLGSPCDRGQTRAERKEDHENTREPDRSRAFVDAGKASALLVHRRSPVRVLLHWGGSPDLLKASARPNYTQ
jgi:hypothetical protein